MDRSFLNKMREGIKVGASLVGTVVGAGFVSGAELVRFFPSEGFLPYVILSAFLFFAAFYFLFRIGKRCGGFDSVLQCVFGKISSIVKGFMLCCSLIMCASMLAGIDAAVREGFALDYVFPYIALLSLILLFFLSGKGMNGVYAVNLILVPLILIFVLYFAPGADYGGTPYDPECGILPQLGSVFLYVSLNTFLAAPVVCDMGARSASGTGCVISSVLIGFCAATVLGCIAREGAGAYTAEMPFLRAVGNGAFLGKIFTLVCLCGIFTTLFSSYYPLYRLSEGKKRGLLFRVCSCLVAFLLSLIGLKRIVGFIYPFVGLAGFLFLGGCIFFYAKKFPAKILFVFETRRGGKEGGHYKSHAQKTHVN